MKKEILDYMCSYRKFCPTERQITNYRLQIRDYKLQLQITNYNYKSQLQIVLSNTPPPLLSGMQARNASNAKNKEGSAHEM